MQDTKNLILAVVLSTSILLLWQVFVEQPKIAALQKQKLEATRKQEALGDINGRIDMAKNDKAIEHLSLTREEALKKEKKIGGRLKLDNGRLHGSIALQGARFDDLTLADYKVSLDKNAKEVALLSPGDANNAYFVEFGWIADDKNIKTPDKNTIWQTNSEVLRPEQPVVLSWTSKQGLVFKLHINIDKNYLFSINQSVENISYDGEIILYPYGIINRVKDIAKQSYLILHEGPLGVMDGILHEISYKDLLEDKKYEYDNVQGWFGITDKYWLTALIPDKNASYNNRFSYTYKNSKHRFQTDFIGDALTIKKGESARIKHNLFTGAKQLELLDKYNKQLDLQLFDRAVDFGWLYFITKPIFKALTFFHGLLGNFGLAILMLTVLVKLLLFPLANKSYISMHHLKRLQPQIMEIKERYGQDKMAFNKHIMELYQREKVNPMSGCLPIFIQIPVFFALYKVLFVTIEMRHAPFYGWIKDLSAPDPTHILNLFGLLPYELPGFLSIGVWPVIMGLTMYIQQRLNPQPTDPVQAKVMKLLPFILIFVFASFPAGLVIYWAWNNVLSIIQQWVITRRVK